MRQRIPEQEAVINCNALCFLVTSRPGRGKTSVALWYAERLLKDRSLKPSQKILFLTFSRNAVYQISTASGILLDESVQSHLHIATYHSFMWFLIQSFGRFSGLPSQLDLIWETKARAVAYSGCCEAKNLPMFFACEAKALTYDCFAPLSISLLKSSRIRNALAELYPIVIIDEFQDTNDEQWEFIKLLTERTRLCCLADPDQMIHRFRGATDDRINQLLAEKQAKEYRLQDRCLRTDDHELLDFAETILDNRTFSKGKRAAWKTRFLNDYFGPNPRSTWLKVVLHRFYTDYRKRGFSGTPSIAIAAYANTTVSIIQKELLKKTDKFKRPYSCKILEPDYDESIEDLIIHIAFWISTSSVDDLKMGIKIIASLIAPKDLSKTSDPIKSLFNPEKLLSGELRPKHTAEIVLNAFTNWSCKPHNSGDALKESSKFIRTLSVNIKTLAKILEDERFEERFNNLLLIVSSITDGDINEQLIRLKKKLTNERLQRCVFQRVIPLKGRVATTMHKLKGKEFDYVMLLTMPGEKFYSPREESELDGRRLLYVTLTRARYDACILYIGSAPPKLLIPYLK